MGSALTLPAFGAELPVEDPDPLVAALAQARSASGPTQMSDAAKALTTLLPRYPQDVDLPLQLAWLMFRSGRYADALYSYQLALLRSTPGSVAELGVAWSLVKLGRCTEAREHFHAVLVVNPTQNKAEEGLRVCAEPPPAAPVPRLWIAPFIAQSLYLYQDHPLVSYATAPTARIELLFRGRLFAAASYRYTYFATNDGQTAAWSQNDLYLDVGVTGKSAAATLHYALLVDGSGYSGITNHIGLSARYSRGFDNLLNLSASIYPDTPVLRGELAWVLPIIGGFSIRPGAALQWTSTETFKNVSLTVSYYHPLFNFWIGGKYGDEKRAAYLTVAYVYNSPATIPYGMWVGATVRPGKKFALTLSYTYDRLLRSDITPNQNSLVHSLTLGLSREF